MNWILDGAVAAIILGCAVAAWRKGLIRAVLGFLPMALALLGTKAVSPFIGRFLRETILFDKMSTAIQTSMGLDTALQEGAMQTQTALIEAMPLPEFLKEALLENNNPVIYQLLHAESLKEYIAGYLANVCINVLSVAAAFVLIYIVVKVVINALHLFSKLPGLNFLNRFSGFLVASLMISTMRRFVSSGKHSSLQRFPASIWKIGICSRFAPITERQELVSPRTNTASGLTCAISL